MEKIRGIQVNKLNKSCENLEELSKEQLISQIKSLQAHNLQLKSILSKSLNRNEVSSPKKQKPFDFTKCSTRHILLKFFYLGWDYQGFATQENTNDTIEYHLFKALERTCLIKDRASSNYHRCGRTDKGVSSFGQVISITVRSKLSEDQMDKIEEEINYCQVLNRVLPKEIQCIAWRPVSEGFSARFDCKSRTYKYFFPMGKLNIENMRKASAYCLGTHDFRNLCKMDVGNGVVEFERTIVEVIIEPVLPNQSLDEYSMFVLTIKSGGFLWHQIRCMLGILFLVGQNKEPPEIIQELLNVEKNPCKPDYNMASEIPLNLYSADYILESDWYCEEENLTTVVEELRKMWTLNSIKSDMMRTMINDLSKELKQPNIKCLSESLIQGIRSKEYLPVMKRKKCDSLEKKIAHYLKRSRITIKDEEKTDL
ncbi:tRNA pseudouridine(38/39) synthase isoform X2 [Coccinella septempunctata]|uniref:tRNA pseudouridine(38/39) synthase isoform X2 n=1 Tax=Coccinella septempunctata TaxID=41139 RepID=UPI001D099D10|nr:tRNA pseudouridine(38/39) synthase isoform X2 [Coccinella septempunctata]